MNKEIIIRREAKKFMDRFSLGSQVVSIERFQKIKERINDFYSPDYKAIFLDEIRILILEELQKHRDDRHGGEAGLSCNWEEQVETLLFYIQQEVGILPGVIQNKYTSSDSMRKKVFISYNRSDKKYLDEIKKHFKPLRQEIDVWDDTKIQPGRKWKDELEKAIKETKIAILLISPDFLASDFIQNDELPALLKASKEDGAVILCVILRYSIFEEIPYLSEYQAMNAPSDPLAKMGEIDREEFYVSLVRQTRKILKQ